MYSEKRFCRKQPVTFPGCGNKFAKKLREVAPLYGRKENQILKCNRIGLKMKTRNLSLGFGFFKRAESFHPF